MKKAIIFAVCIMSMTMLTACSSESIEGYVKGAANSYFLPKNDDSYDTDDRYDSDDTYDTVDVEDWDDRDSLQDQQDEIVIGTEDLQSLYGKAAEYDYMALGYYQDPDNSTGLRDGYVPYDENYVQESTEYLKSEAHGISVRLYMVDADTATEANEKCADIYKEQLEERQISAQFSEVNSFDHDTIAYCYGGYENEDEQAVCTFLYSDVRDDGTKYMCAEIEFNESEFDDVTFDLMKEMDDAYGLVFSSVFE